MSALTVSLVQTPTDWHAPERNQQRFERLLRDVPTGADLVVLPEMFSTGFTMASAEVAEPMSGSTVRWLQLMAQAIDAVITGSVVIEESGHRYNRLLWAEPDGGLQHYDKKTLFSAWRASTSITPAALRVRCSSWLAGACARSSVTT